MDSCSGLRFPVEPAPGLATSSVPCDPVVTRCGFLGQDAGLWSQCLSNHLPQGAVEKLNQLLKNKNKPAACRCEAVYGLRSCGLDKWPVLEPGSGLGRRPKSALPPAGGSRGETGLKQTLGRGAGPSFPRPVRDLGAVVGSTGDGDDVHSVCWAMGSGARGPFLFRLSRSGQSKPWDVSSFCSCTESPFPTSECGRDDL